MAIGPLIRFFSSATDFAREEVGAPDQSVENVSSFRKQQRAVIAGGAVGGVIGLVFAVITAVALWTHPDQGKRPEQEIGTIVFAVLLALAIGVLSGSGWVCGFLPDSFFAGPAGAKWMALVGTSKPFVARLISLLVGVLGIGACVGLLVCVATGHI